ncbi:signal peptidase I [Arenimonas aestuarii]
MSTGPARTSKRRPATWLFAAALAGALAVAAYLINPLGTASSDYGARLWGRTTLAMPSGAMEPTLVEGYELVVDTRAFRSSPPQADDLLVYQGPQGPRVGRVVAGPGQQVALRLGELFVDGEMMPAPAGVDVEVGAGAGRDLPETPVPPGHVFVLVDHRDLGGDSRESGPVPARQWIGKVVAVRR